MTQSNVHVFTVRNRLLEYYMQLSLCRHFSCEADLTYVRSGLVILVREADDIETSFYQALLCSNCLC